MVLKHYMKSTREDSFQRITSDFQLSLLSDLRVSVDCYEPECEPAFHHCHYAPDHPLLQWDSPSQFCSVSGMYMQITAHHISFLSKAYSWFHLCFLPVVSKCDVLGDTVLCFADNFPDHTILSIKFQ